MFWIALSLLIMSLTGEGDDTFAFRKVLERGRDAVEEKVPDPARRKAAVTAIDRATDDFSKHRKRVGKISACVEKTDRKYVVTEAEYERCLADLGPAWDAAGEDLIELERVFRASLTEGEIVAVRRAAE
ncbi:MAG TPA: hypothetical protein VF103_02730 [Polyangiaceae bacterium]